MTLFIAFSDRTST